MDFRSWIMPTALHAEITQSSPRELHAYIHGAAHDGTLSKRHGTLRIAQADVRWLCCLQLVFREVGRRSWFYREGSRNVWVVETSHRSQIGQTLGDAEARSYARGYFDAEGGLPKQCRDRLYIQFVQKDLDDLADLRNLLTQQEIMCGKLHNPSARKDPDLWRFYVSAVSHFRFMRTIGSWHPGKRARLYARLKGRWSGSVGAGIPNMKSQAELPECAPTRGEATLRLSSFGGTRRPQRRSHSTS
jgi:hypothetical protein